jgi:hypothetical protein
MKDNSPGRDHKNKSLSQQNLLPPHTTYSHRKVTSSALGSTSNINSTHAIGRNPRNNAGSIHNSNNGTIR